MGNKPKLDHRFIVAYLKGKAGNDALSQITKIKDRYQEYTLLFDLIDRVKHTIENIGRSDETGKSIFSFSEIDDLIIQILAGGIDPDLALTFMNALENSPDFYERILFRLQSLETRIEGEEVAELDQVQMKSDDEILDTIQSQVKRGGRFRNVFQSTWNKLIDLTKNSGPMPRYAFVVPVIAIVTVLVLTIFNRSGDEEHFLFDNSVPIAFQPTAVTRLRGLSVRSELRKDFDAFHNQFIEGMLYYEDLEYLQAVRILEPLQGKADQFQKTLTDTLAMSVVRDYYFYTGVTYLAVSRTKIDEVHTSIKKQSLMNAEQFLIKSSELTDRYDLKLVDREKYFLGLVYLLSGDRDSLIKCINQISESSPFYQEGGKLIKMKSR